MEGPEGTHSTAISQYLNNIVHITYNVYVMGSDSDSHSEHNDSAYRYMYMYMYVHVYMEIQVLSTLATKMHRGKKER